MAENCSNHKPIADQHFSDRTMQQAGLQACQECPFRKANRGRVHPDLEPYTDPWLTSIWRNVPKDGGSFGCHMFDAEAVHYSEDVKGAGYKKPADIGERKECAGMVAMVRRELEVILKSATYSDYAKARPFGLTEKSAEYFTARLNGEIEPPLRFSDYIDLADILDMHDVVDASDISWTFSESFLQDLHGFVKAINPAGNECACIVCTRHSEVHKMKTLSTADGESVKVDADLHALLHSMARAGIRTTSSCINIREAAAALAPNEVGPLMNAARRDVIGYEKPMRAHAPFIELRTGKASEDAFLKIISGFHGVTVTKGMGRAQAVFSTRHIPVLTALASVISRKI